MSEKTNAGKVSCTGGCHCGRVKFEVKVPPNVTASLCNCSICSKSGFVHVIVGRSDMTLLKGESDLQEYKFNTRTAKHLFCGHCGVKSFYVPRSHPDGFSVNLNCLDSGSGIEVEIRPFDGRHWRNNIDRLKAEHGTG